MKRTFPVVIGLVAWANAALLTAGCGTSAGIADGGSSDSASSDVGPSCPATAPATGSPCAPAGAECGYSDQPNPCGASNCYCQAGGWTCEPTCIFDAAVEGATEADSPALQCTDTSRLVSVSDYDQSCQSDSDCVGVGAGVACLCTTVVCVTAEINVSAYAQWKVDVGYAKYMADLPTTKAQCSCPPIGVPCCNAGKCVWPLTGQCHDDASAPDGQAQSDAGDANPE